MREESLRSDKMGSMSVGKLLISMSVPAMLSMLVQALYNIVDSIFIGLYDPGLALDAVNVAMPFQMLPLALALGIGVGTNAATSKALGENNAKKASRYVQTGLVMAGIAYFFVIFIGLFLSGVYAKGFSEGSAELEKLTTQYLTIVVTVSGFMFVETIFSKSLQSTGNMIVPMIAQLVGAITNIILDPVCIFVFDMGIVGAAVATVTGQAFAMIFVICAFFLSKQDVDLDFKGFRMKAETVKNIFLVGIPTAVLNGLSSVTTILMYSVLGNTGAITILGLYFKVQSFVFMPVFGLNQGAMPIMSYNFGRADRKRFLRTYWLSIGIAAGILLIGVLIFLTAPQFLLGLFNLKDAERVQMGANAFRIICASFLPAAFGIITITLLQATQNGIMAMIVAFCRQLVFLVPGAMLIKALAGEAYLDYIWWCYPIAEVLALGISLPFGRYLGIKAFDRRERECERRREELIGE